MRLYMYVHVLYMYMYVYVTVLVHRWYMNPKALEVVDMSEFDIEAGDLVVPIVDVAEVRRLQEGFGGWVDSMKPVHTTRTHVDISQCDDVAILSAFLVSWEERAREEGGLRSSGRRHQRIQFLLEQEVSPTRSQVT